MFFIDWAATSMDLVEEEIIYWRFAALTSSWCIFSPETFTVSVSILTHAVIFLSLVYGEAPNSLLLVKIQIAFDLH